MKYILISVLILLALDNSYCQGGGIGQFSLNISVGKSFLSYGDIWGGERKMSLQYGRKFYVAIDYGFADFEGAKFTQDYYESLENSTLVDKNLNSIIGNSEVKFFGLKPLDTKDNLITINSYQIKVGRDFNLFTPKLQLGLFGSAGILKLRRIATDFLVSGIDIQNPSFTFNDVTIFGTFTHGFFDLSYGFGAEFNYEILEKRLKLSLISVATLSTVRWFTIGLGAKVNI